MAPTDAILRTILSANLPTEQKLRGQDNQITQYSSILTLLRLFDLKKYFLNENSYNTISEQEKTTTLVIVSQNLTEKLLSLVLTEKDPGIIFTNLKASYEETVLVLWQQLYLQFH